MLRANSPDAKDKRREVIILAALDEFYQKGFAAARLEDIALAAGVSKGSLYLYFSSKKDIFVAMIETLAFPVRARFEEFLKSSKSINDALHRYSEFAPSVIQEATIPKLLKVQIGDCHCFPSLVDSCRNQIVDPILVGIAEKMDMSPAEGRILAQMIVAPFLSVSIWTVIFGTGTEVTLNIEALFDSHADFMAKGLSLQKSEAGENP